jgi:acetoin utilization deacetylase AcuC-like enzyme
MQLFQHADCLQHLPGPTHPECPDRQRVILNALQHQRVPMTAVEAPLGTQAQVLLAHTPMLWQHVNAMNPSNGTASLDPDTHLSPGSLTAALRGVGAACAGIDALLAGNTDHAFCLTRPPGHHATPTHSMGFCIFNHAAIAALYAQQQGLQRIAIVDFDVHHGNGTQDICSGKAGLFYISTHQFPHYPGTGAITENKDSNILNVPLSRQVADQEYRAIFSDAVMPALHAFKPQLLVVSAGFDAHAQDPLGGLAFTERTYEWLGQQLRTVANTYANGRLLSVLEGGYNLNVLGESVAAYCQGALSSTA